MAKKSVPANDMPAQELEPEVGEGTLVTSSRPGKAICPNCGWRGEWWQTVDSIVGQLCPTCLIPAVEDRSVAPKEEVDA